MRSLHLYVHIPQPVFRARVNLASPSYPLILLPFDTVTLGAYTDVQPDQFFTVGSTLGGDDRGRGRTRYLATASELTIPRTSRGTRDGELDVQDNDYITVYEDYRINAKYPYISPTGEQFKDSNVDVIDGLGNFNIEIPPVANTGPAFADYIDPVTGLITVEFPGAGAFSYTMADGATIASYNWDIKDGTAIAGNVATSTVTATFPAGFRYVGLTIIDSNGRPHGSRIPVLAVDPASDPTIKGWADLHLTRRIDGQELTFKLLDELPRETYPDGTLVLLWEDEPDDPEDRTHMLFHGWLYSESGSKGGGETGLRKDGSILALDAAGILKRLPGFPQSLSDELLRDTEIEPETTWLYMEAPNVDKFHHSLAMWQSTALINVDFYLSGTGDEYPFVELQASGDNLWGQLARLPQMLVPDYVLTCNAMGQIKTLADPMLLDTGSRSATIMLSLAETDISDIGWSYQRAPLYYVLWGQALLTSTSYVVVDDDETITEVRSIAPGEAFGQGTSEATHIEQIAKSQIDLNKVTGHRYARMNARYKYLSITLPGFDPRDLDIASLGWVQLTLSAETAERLDIDTTVRGLIHSADIAPRMAETGLTIDVRVELELETSGTPALTWIPGEGVP